MIYVITPKELRVMLQLLEDAASTGSLSTEQLDALTGDPMDLVRDLINAEVFNVSVFARDARKPVEDNRTGVLTSAHARTDA